jgi:uncharacterized protein YegJ (DUF2314 family)
MKLTSMKPIAFKIIPILLIVILCSEYIESATVSERGAEPETFDVDAEDAEMNRAIKQARDTIQIFLKRLVTRKPNQTHFSVKKPFPVGKDGENEHIWIDDLRYDGKRLHGRISNTPVDLRSPSREIRFHFYRRKFLIG